MLFCEYKDLIQRGLYAPEFFMDELWAKIDTVKVIGQYVKLYPRGGTGSYKNEFVGLCPFHIHRKNRRSFTVSPDKGFYHCFGCGTQGTSIQFLQRIKKSDYPQAIAHVARIVGMPVKYYDSYKEDYFRELEAWESALQEAQSGRGHQNIQWFLITDQASRERLIEKSRGNIEYYQKAVAAIMETKDRRHSRFYGKSYEEFVGEPIYPISDELLEILERDRTDRETDIW